MHDDTCGEVAIQATVRGQRCVHGVEHSGACETAPVNEGDKHGFMWWPVERRSVGWVRV